MKVRVTKVDVVMTMLSAFVEALVVVHFAKKWFNS